MTTMTTTMSKSVLWTLAVALIGMGASLAHGQDSPDASSGFLTDYSLLKPSARGQVGTWVYVAPDATDKAGSYKAIIIDQPAFAIAPDSKVKALKPDDIKVIAEAFRKVIADEISPGYDVVDEPGPGVLGLRTSFSNIYVEKKGRRLLAYTPIGFVVTEAKQAMLDDVMDKVKLTQTTVEVELVDSVTGEVFAAAMDERGRHSDKKEHATWKEVQAVLAQYAKRVKCNLDNARVPADQRTDCYTIGIVDH